MEGGIMDFSGEFSAVQEVISHKPEISDQLVRLGSRMSSRLLKDECV